MAQFEAGEYAAACAHLTRLESMDATLLSGMQTPFAFCLAWQGHPEQAQLWLDAADDDSDNWQLLRPIVQLMIGNLEENGWENNVWQLETLVPVSGGKSPQIGEDRRSPSEVQLKNGLYALCAAQRLAEAHSMEGSPAFLSWWQLRSNELLQQVDLGSESWRLRRMRQDPALEPLWTLPAFQAATQPRAVQ